MKEESSSAKAGKMGKWRARDTDARTKHKAKVYTDSSCVVTEECIDINEFVVGVITHC